MAKRWRIGRARLAALRNPRSLGARLVVTLTGVGLAASLAIAVLLASVITPNFNRLEEASLATNVSRTRIALHDFARGVETAVRDYGDWNSSYDYMARPTRAFEAESFSTLAMRNLNVAAMAYVGNDGRVVLARWIDLQGGIDRPALRQRFVTAIAAQHLTRMAPRDSSTAFYLRLGDRLAAIGVARVRRSDGSGAPRGFVLMARELTSPQIANLLQLPARIDLDDRVAEVAVAPRRADMAIAVPIAGPDGGTVAAARFTVKRDLSLLGRRMLLAAVGGAIVLLALVLLMLRRVIARLVLKPLHRVERHMGVVRESGTLTVLPDEGRRDEIGSLVTSFNSMLCQLKDLREQVEAQSYRLGQNESAVAVMHNVRNALNPISTVLSQGADARAPIDRATLDRALGELAGEEIPPARRQKLVAYLAAAAAAGERQRADTQRGLALGREALRNVLEIIGEQQHHAHEKPALAACDISDVVARNAIIARHSNGLSIAFSFPARPHIALANRVILSQVVGNVLANAAEAIAARGGGGGTIEASVLEVDGRVDLTIRDDGEGFDAGMATTMFQRGFSTRAHKSGGLGLHWCANAMLAMGGALRLESDGIGCGARAVLSLPAAPADGALAAA